MLSYLIYKKLQSLCFLNFFFAIEKIKESERINSDIKFIGYTAKKIAYQEIDKITICI